MIKGFQKLTDGSYQPLDQTDAQLLDMFNECIVNNTTLPSGVVTPPRDMRAHQGKLYEIEDEA